MSLNQVVQVPFSPERYGQSGGVLLNNLSDSSPAGALGMIEDDDFALQLFPRLLPTTLGGSTSTLQLSSGSSIIFSIKSQAGISSAALLGEATGFTEYQDGSGNWYYGAVLSLQAAAVATALGNNPSVPCIGEIFITDSTGAQKRYQFLITLYQAVYTSGSTSPVAPTPGTVLSFTAGSQAVASGVDFVTVTGLGLASVPALFLPQLVKADGTHGNIDCVLRSGWTTDGFTIDLTGVTTDATYLLTWIIASSSGSVGSLAVPAGVDHLFVPLTLPRAPTLILPVLVKQIGDGNIRALLRAGWTGAGFTIDFTATTPDATYVLYYLLIP